MKRLLLVLVLSPGLVLGWVSVSQSQFAVTQLTNNAVQDSWLQPTDLKINASGQMVWEESDDAFTYSDILFYDGVRVIRITDDIEQDFYPSANDNGHVVWTRTSQSLIPQIYLWDGSSRKKLSNNPDRPDYYSQINNHDQVVWMGYDGNDSEVFLYGAAGVTQLTDNDYDDEFPQINDAGHVVWVANDQIFLYDGGSTTNISNNEYRNEWPKVNDSDQVVWQADPGTGNLEIFFYDGTSVTQLTNNTYNDRFPKINNSGHVVWEGEDSDSDSEIFLFDGTITTNLTLDNTYSAHSPWINNNGEVVWAGVYCTGNTVVFLYDGTQSVAVSDPSSSNDIRSTQIGNGGHIAWVANDGHDYEMFLAEGTPPPPPPYPYTVTRLTDNSEEDVWTNPMSKTINASGKVVWDWNDGDGEIFLYNGATSIQITNDTNSDWDPAINDNGTVVWTRVLDGGSGPDAEIYLYDGTGMRDISNNPDVMDYMPGINNAGQVVWTGYDGNDTEIFLYDGTSVSQITHNDYADEYPQINSPGHVTWVGNGQIFLYDGASVTNISNNAFVNQWPVINDSDQVVWQARVSGENSEIFLYSGAVGGVQLTSNSYDDVWPRINNSGYVAWEAQDTDSDSEIYLFDGFGTTNLTADNPKAAHRPWINNGGEVVWQSEDLCTGNPIIVLYDGTKSITISDPADGTDKQLPRIGDGGHVAWQGYDAEPEIYLAKPPTPPACTDNDGDGYGNPAGPACTHPEMDCDDSNPNVNPGMTEIPQNGIDDDCNPNTPTRWGPPASTLGVMAASQSDQFNYFASLLVPFVGIILWKGLRRRG